MNSELRYGDYVLIVDGFYQGHYGTLIRFLDAEEYLFPDGRDKVLVMLSNGHQAEVYPTQIDVKKRWKPGEEVPVESRPSHPLYG